MYLPILMLGLDMIWFVSTIIIILVVYLTFRAVIKLPRYATDRRRHFYPLQTIILVIGGIQVLLQVVFWATDHTPPTPVFSLPPLATFSLAWICIGVVLGQNIYQRRLPLTDNQRKYRKRKR